MTEKEVPDGVVVASNGAWRDAETGRFVQGGQPETAITAENSIEYQRLWQEKKVLASLAAEGGLASAFKGKPTPLSAWSHIVEKQASLAIKKDYTSTKAADFVGKATGYLASDRGNGSDPVPAGGARLEIGADGLDRLLEIITTIREEA